MIQKDYVLQMARYNAFQNNQLRRIVQNMDETDLMADRGAVFGSIFGTLNHLLWGDTLWMSRWCSDVPAPQCGIPDSPTFTPTAGVWDAERFCMDGRIRIWAQTLINLDLHEDLTWFSGAIGQRITRPKALCITHMFNHQTHHRGQISQMLSDIGVAPAVSDIVFMPEDA